VGHDGCVGDRSILTDLMMSARPNILAKGKRLSGVSAPSPPQHMQRLVSSSALCFWSSWLIGPDQAKVAPATAHDERPHGNICEAESRTTHNP
jgi:hypothetical protein